MKQTALLGRTAGLRPAQSRRLERLSHRRHPEGTGVDLLSLQRLAAESVELELPLSLVIDSRGLCRLLWVGPLEQSGRLLERLPGGPRRQGGDLRLVTCVGRTRQLEPQGSEAVVGLDLQPRLWLRYSDSPEPGGRWPAAAYTASSDPHHPWQLLATGELAELSALAPPAPSGSSGGDGAKALRQTTEPPGERVLLLALTATDPEEARRQIAELDRELSSPARPVPATPAATSSTAAAKVKLAARPAPPVPVSPATSHTSQTPSDRVAAAAAALKARAATLEKPFQQEECTPRCKGMAPASWATHGAQRIFMVNEANKHCADDHE